MTTAIAPEARCPCRKKSETVRYADCCRPFHHGERPAPTAEALMRSRYAAFVTENEDYLLATWHPKTRPECIEFTPGQEWLLLRVIDAATDGDTASVEFEARTRFNGKTHVLHEVSQFVRESGRWLYVSGNMSWH